MNYEEQLKSILENMQKANKLEKEILEALASRIESIEERLDTMEERRLKESLICRQNYGSQ